MLLAGLLLWDDEDLLHLQGSRWLDIAKQGGLRILFPTRF